MTAPRPTFGFLSLPSELHIRIYEISMVESNISDERRREQPELCACPDFNISHIVVRTWHQCPDHLHQQMNFPRRSGISSPLLRWKGLLGRAGMTDSPQALNSSWYGIGSNTLRRSGTVFCQIRCHLNTMDCVSIECIDRLYILPLSIARD